jgi:hypothetical protein
MVNLERGIKTEFKLTSKELRRLRPLIRRENENVARTFGRFSDERHRDNFLSLWDGIRSGRREFEATLPAEFNQREKNALRAARSVFESIVIDIWIEEYVGMLESVLEIDRFQVSYVQGIFDEEAEKRHRLIKSETEITTGSTLEWEQITTERDKSLKNILSPDQFKQYLSLGDGLDGPLA